MHVSPSAGLSTGLSPLYNSEVAPVSLRGAVGVLNQLAVTVGISVSQILGLTEILGDDVYWPLLLGERARGGVWWVGGAGLRQGGGEVGWSGVELGGVGAVWCGTVRWGCSSGLERCCETRLGWGWGRMMET